MTVYPDHSGADAGRADCVETWKRVTLCPCGSWTKIRFSRLSLMVLCCIRRMRIYRNKEIRKMKSLFSGLFPGERQKSACAIDYERWFQRGKRGIIYDIDNTLVPHGAPADDGAKKLFDRLRRIGFRTCLLSNNNEKRVRPFAEAVGTKYVVKAGKPKRGGYWKACEIMGVDTSEALLVGDQIFTDIWGANRAGITNILVDPIHPKEEFQIILKRIPEKIILFFYGLHNR